MLRYGNDIKVLAEETFSILIENMSNTEVHRNLLAMAGGGNFFYINRKYDQHRDSEEFVGHGG